MERARLVRAANSAANVGTWLLLAGLMAGAVFVIRPGDAGPQITEAAGTGHVSAVAPATERATTVYLVFESAERASGSAALARVRRADVRVEPLVVPGDEALAVLVSLLTSEAICPPASCGPALVLDLRHL